MSRGAADRAERADGWVGEQQEMKGRWMMNAQSRMGSSWSVALIAALILAVLAVAVLAGADDQGARLERKIRIMESVLDETMVQSENVVVSGLNSTRGLVLDGYGALFTVETSGMGLIELREGRAFARMGGESWISLGRLPEERAEHAEQEELEELQRSWKEQQEETARRQQERVEALIAELKGTLLDYGGTLAELKDGDRVTVAVFSGGRSRLGGGDERIVISAQMRDLRQYMAGSLGREAALERIVVESTEL